VATDPTGVARDENSAEFQAMLIVVRHHLTKSTFLTSDRCLGDYHFSSYRKRIHVYLTGFAYSLNIAEAA
jgi:hypothetical protein